MLATRDYNKSIKLNRRTTRFFCGEFEVFLSAHGWFFAVNLYWRYAPILKRIKMKYIILLAALFYSSVAISKPVNCDGSPNESVTALPAPIDDWALIFCSPSGHALAPIDGTIWLGPNGKPFLFQSASLSSAPKLENPHSAYFSSVIHRKLDGQFKYGTNKMLTKAGLPEDQTLQPWQLDVKTNKGELYNVFFYIKDDALVHILGCINRCQTSVLLTPKPLSQLSRELSK